MTVQSRLVTLLYGGVMAALLAGVAAARGAAFLENDDRRGGALREGGPQLVLVLGMIVPVLLALLALGLFLWAIHAGQFDDLETPAIRILLDEESHPAAEAAPRPTPHDAE